MKRWKECYFAVLLAVCMLALAACTGNSGIRTESGQGGTETGRIEDRKDSGAGDTMNSATGGENGNGNGNQESRGEGILDDLGDDIRDGANDILDGANDILDGLDGKTATDGSAAGSGLDGDGTGTSAGSGAAGGR